MYGGSNMKTYIAIHKIANGNLHMSQGTQTGALYQPRGVRWGGRFKRQGAHVYLWLIYIDV